MRNPAITVTDMYLIMIFSEINIYYCTGALLPPGGGVQGTGGLALWPRLRGLRDHGLHRESDHRHLPQLYRGQGQYLLKHFTKEEIDRLSA